MEQQSKRLAQSYALLILAFVVPVTSSALIFLGLLQPSTAGPVKIAIKIGFELCALIGLCFVLSSQKRSLQSIGFSPTPTAADVGHSVLLFITAYGASAVAYAVVGILSFAVVGHPPKTWNGVSQLFGDARSVLPLIFVLVSPFFEEMLGRAFLMTEIEAQFASPRIAVVASIVLQTLYHTYQGLPNALSLAAAFSIFSIYFVTQRRILPVILAHLYMDVLGFFIYMLYPRLYS